MKRKCAAIGQAIIAACRPRSCISPILLALTTFIQKKYGSRELIDILSSLGLVESHSEAVDLVNAQLKDNSSPLPDSVDVHRPERICGGTTTN